MLRTLSYPVSVPCTPNPVPVLKPSRQSAFASAAPTWAALPPPTRPEVAFVGRSNVGKSSLLNALLGRKALARTSGTPGKTQALNFYTVGANAQGDGGLYFVDLPGYGYAKVSKGQRAAWERLMVRYLLERAEDDGPLRAVVQLIDSRHPPTKLDEDLIGLVVESEAAHVIALTKADKLSANARQKAVSTLRKHLARYHIERPIVLTSAEKKTGLDELWGWIETALR